MVAGRQNFSSPCRHRCLSCHFKYCCVPNLYSEIIKRAVCILKWSPPSWYQLQPIWSLFWFFWRTRWIFLSTHFLLHVSSFDKCLVFLLTAWLSSMATYLVNPVSACQASQPLSEDHVQTEVKSLVEIEEKSLKSKAVCSRSFHGLFLSQIILFNVKLHWFVEEWFKLYYLQIICTAEESTFRFIMYR